MKLFNRLCGHGKELAEVKNQRDKADADLFRWKAVFYEKEKECRDLARDFLSLEAELAKTKREQTEADLFFVTAKIQKELLDGKKIGDPNLQGLLSQQRDYQAQLAAMQGPVASPFGFLGGIGNGPPWPINSSIKSG